MERFAICIGEIPGVICVFVLLADDCVLLAIPARDELLTSQRHHHLDPSHTTFRLRFQNKKS